MTVVLVERNGAVRRALGEFLRELGATSVLPFGSPPIAFLFLVGRLRDVDAVVLDQDDDGAEDLLRRLRVLPATFATVVYSGRRLDRALRRRSKRPHDAA